MPDTDVLATDPVSRRFGPEYPGRVRAMGLGVTPSKVCLTIHSERRYTQLSQDYRASIAQREEMDRRMSSMEREMAEIRELVRARTRSTPSDQVIFTVFLIISRSYNLDIVTLNHINATDTGVSDTGGAWRAELAETSAGPTTY